MKLKTVDVVPAFSKFSVVTDVELFVRVDVNNETEWELRFVDWVRREVYWSFYR